MVSLATSEQQSRQGGMRVGGLRSCMLAIRYVLASSKYRETVSHFLRASNEKEQGHFCLNFVDISCPLL